MSHSQLQQWITPALADRQEAQLFRKRRVVNPLSSTHVQIDRQPYINFCSNDYLGLTHHPRVINAISNATQAGSGAAGLISGYTPAHEQAERDIAQLEGTEASIILPSGYQANHAAVQTLVGIAETQRKTVRFLVDKLVHASLIDAVRQPGVEFRVFPHNQFGKLRRLLEEADPNQLQVVLTESIFSMDGDACLLNELVELKKQHPFALLLDEAHGTGVYGKNGSGYASEKGLREHIDISIVTLSKAIGVSGGAICGSADLCSAVVNFGRAMIFSTNIPPAIASAVSASIAVMRDEPQHQDRVRQMAQHVRNEFASMKLEVPPGDSPIIPVILGEASQALEASEKLFIQGILVIAVRPPTVPRGASRLRVTVSSAHTDAEIEFLLQSIKRLV